jgi:hypothetical protein
MIIFNIVIYQSEHIQTIIIKISLKVIIDCQGLLKGS